MKIQNMISYYIIFTGDQIILFTFFVISLCNRNFSSAKANWAKYKFPAFIALIKFVSY